MLDLVTNATGAMFNGIGKVTDVVVNKTGQVAMEVGKGVGSGV